jgi:hypothetical protein
MDRRKFLAGSVAVGAVTLTANSHARSFEPHGSRAPVSAASGTKSANSRLQYPLTKEEKANATVVFDLTFPTNDVRRYKPPAEVDGRAALADYMDSM